jgi:tetratricopeptide (TPR) repeat protein
MARKLTARRFGLWLFAGLLLQAALSSGPAVAVPLRFDPLYGDQTLLQLLQQGEFAKVRDEARRQLVRNAADGDMRAVLAYALTELGELQDAERNARQAIEMLPAERRDHLRVLLAEILLRTGRTPEAIQVLNDIVARDATNTLALVSLGNLYNRTGNVPRAAEYFEKALAVDPGQDDALKQLLQAYMTQGDYAAVARVARRIPASSESKGLGYYFEALSLLQRDNPDNRTALELLDKALQVSAPTPQVLTTLGYVLLKEQRPEEAATHLVEAVKLAPDSFDAVNLLGIAAIQLGRPEIAVRPVERALANRERPELRHVLARLYLLQGRVDQGLGELLKSADDPSQLTDSESELQTLYEFKSGEFEQSESGLRAALAKAPDAAHLRFLLIVSLLKQNRFEGAAREAQQALTLLPDQSVLLLNLLAMAKLGSAEFAAAEAALQTAQKRDPASKTTRVNLSTVYYRTQRYTQAEKELKSILANDANDTDATIRLARVYRAAGKYAEAERVLVAAQARKAAAGAATRELIFLKLRERDYAAALDYASGMVATYPKSFEGYLFRAHALASLGREIDAVDALDAGFETAGETRGSLAAAASLARVHGWHEMAVNYLQRYDAQFGLSDPTLEKLYATELIEVGRTGDARAIVNASLGATDPDALLLLAMSYLADGDQAHTEEYLDAALDAGVSAGTIERQRAALRAAVRIETLKTDLEAAPDDVLRYEALAGANELVGDFDAAIAVFKAGLGRAGADLSFQTHIARLTLKKGEAQQAIEIADDVLADPNADGQIRIRANAVLGMSWVVQRDRAKAEKALELATVDGSTLAPAFYELAKIKAAKGDVKTAQKLLRSAIEIEPASLRFYLALATLHERSNDIAGSIAVYEDGISKNPGAVPLLNNVALLYLGQGANERALARAQEALEQAPQDANVLDTVGWIHVQSQDVQGAIRYLERAVDYQPDASLYRYHLGVGYFQAGSMDLAKVELEKALDRQDNAPWAPEIRNVLAAIRDR